MSQHVPSPDRTEIDRLVAEVVEQQERLQLVHFGNADAWRLGCLLVELGQERGLPISVDIRRHGHQLFHASLEGTVPDNDAWLARKARTVDRFGVPSYLVGLRHRRKGTTLGQDGSLDPRDYAAHGGSFPITVRGVGVVGTVTVSGLAQADDHALVVEALELFLAPEPGTAR